MVQLILILDNIRSAHNVGAILRTCDAAGVTQVFASGITPYPELPGDSRDPVIRRHNHAQIAKTALGAEISISVEHYNDTAAAIAAARAGGCTLYGLELTPDAVDLFATDPTSPAALVVGNEVDGLSPSTLAACDNVVKIPQRGSKESLNVAVAAGIAMYAFLK